MLALVSASLLELAFRLDQTGRTFLFFLVTAVTGILFIWHVLLPMLRSLGVVRSIDDSKLAARVGEHFPQIHDRLLNLLQLNEELASGKSLYSPELVDASFQDLAGEIQPLNFTDAVDSSPITRSLKLFGVCAAGSLLLLMGSPTQFYDSLFRITHFNRAFVIPSEFVFRYFSG